MKVTNDIPQPITGLALLQQYAGEFEAVLAKWETRGTGNGVFVQSQHNNDVQHFTLATGALLIYRQANKPADFDTCMAILKALAIHRNEKHDTLANKTSYEEFPITEPTLVGWAERTKAVNMDGHYGDYKAVQDQYAYKMTALGSEPIFFRDWHYLNKYYQHAHNYAHNCHINLDPLKKKLEEFYCALHDYRRKGDTNDTHWLQIVTFIKSFNIPDTQKDTYLREHHSDIAKEACGKYYWKVWILLPICIAAACIATSLWVHEQGPGVEIEDPGKGDYVELNIVSGFIGFLIGCFGSYSIEHCLMHKYKTKWVKQFDEIKPANDTDPLLPSIPGPI